jgi:hypothetical protein
MDETKNSEMTQVEHIKKLEDVISQQNTDIRVLLERLEKAAEVIHEEFCGSVHHDFCLDVKGVAKNEKSIWAEDVTIHDPAWTPDLKSIDGISEAIQILGKPMVNSLLRGK